MPSATIPGVAEFRSRSKNEWLGGAHSRTRVQGFWGANQVDSTRNERFRLEGGEPKVLLSGNWNGTKTA